MIRVCTSLLEELLQCIVAKFAGEKAFRRFRVGIVLYSGKVFQSIPESSEFRIMLYQSEKPSQAGVI